MAPHAAPSARHARFEDGDFSFLLHENPFAGETIHPSPYRMGKRTDDANTYRVGHPLAQRVLALGRGLNTPPAEVGFRYTGSGRKFAILEPLVGRAGWLACARLTVSAMETENHFLLAGATDEGEALDEAQCRRLFDLPAAMERACRVPEPVAARLAEAHARRQRELLEELDQALKAARKAARLAPTLPEKLELQREARVLEGKRDDAWRAFDQASREPDRQKDALLDDMGRQLTQKLEQETLFTLRWSLS